jgi:hypothetical protein
MAFVDLGDQFIALERASEPVAAGHYGLVVDDQTEVVRRAREAGMRMVGSHDFLDPWGTTGRSSTTATSSSQVGPRPPRNGARRAGKSERLSELRSKNLAD